MNTYAKDIANTIIQQFGGNRAFQMIGVSNASFQQNTNTNIVDPILPMGNEGDVIVDIRFKAKADKVNGKSPNGIRIIYNQGNDVYTLVFFRIYGMKLSQLKTIEHAYGDMLQDIFETNTKLYLSF